MGQMGKSSTALSNENVIGDYRTLTLTFNQCPTNAKHPKRLQAEQVIRELKCRHSVSTASCIMHPSLLTLKAQRQPASTVQLRVHLDPHCQLS